ncbi:unnamed protein product [Peronospora belbahrii]|uniref:Origin recognition complex subunit 4 C-terminal domain-containing protein n=1 Tax=Peronospora belbahrii TaxID=622444 RepID=A0ABN8CMJ8_9STRA|nr:unnamed protein product [Peronospora belbahrii]
MNSRTSRSFLNNPPSRRSGNNLVDLLSFDKISWDFYSDLRQPSADYTAAFSTSVYELFVEPSKFLASLEFDYDIGESQDCFVRLAVAAVYYISVDEPLLTAQHFRLARHLLEQDHQLAVLETVTEHGIALLIGMGHLGKAVSVCLRWKWYTLGGKTFFVFTTCLHDMLAQLPTRSEARKALENLLQLKLVMGAGDAFKIGQTKKGYMNKVILAHCSVISCCTLEFCGTKLGRCDLQWLH